MASSTDESNGRAPNESRYLKLNTEIDDVSEKYQLEKKLVITMNIIELYLADKFGNEQTKTRPRSDPSGKFGKGSDIKNMWQVRGLCEGKAQAQTNR
ncbi:hypothetical protein AAES_168871 [Amazona aestiva]|uniref:Uncharacterized protein n=1 Tax=Amazona aestiva TaxID=12930 RepID=A0A0Q3NYC6_AMAAE|nr:hypothetical protein AAES_168871 [Amazona aestiva]